MIEDIYISGAVVARGTMRRSVFQTEGWGSNPEDWNGAKTATQSQEIPNGVMLVLPISLRCGGWS